MLGFTSAAVQESSAAQSATFQELSSERSWQAARHSSAKDL